MRYGEGRSGVCTSETEESRSSEELCCSVSELGVPYLWLGDGQHLSHRYLLVLEMFRNLVLQVPVLFQF